MSKFPGKFCSTPGIIAAGIIAYFCAAAISINKSENLREERRKGAPSFRSNPLGALQKAGDFQDASQIIAAHYDEVLGEEFSCRFGLSRLPPRYSLSRVIDSAPPELGRYFLYGIAINGKFPPSLYPHVHLLDECQPALLDKFLTKDGVDAAVLKSFWEQARTSPIRVELSTAAVSRALNMSFKMDALLPAASLTGNASEAEHLWDHLVKGDKTNRTHVSPLALTWLWFECCRLSTSTLTLGNVSGEIDLKLLVRLLTDRSPERAPEMLCKVLAGPDTSSGKTLSGLRVLDSALLLNNRDLNDLATKEQSTPGSIPQNMLALIAARQSIQLGDPAQFYAFSTKFTGASQGTIVSAGFKELANRDGAGTSAFVASLPDSAGKAFACLGLMRGLRDESDRQAWEIESKRLEGMVK